MLEKVVQLRTRLTAAKMYNEITDFQFCKTSGANNRMLANIFNANRSLQGHIDHIEFPKLVFIKLLNELIDLTNLLGTVLNLFDFRCADLILYSTFICKS